MKENTIEFKNDIIIIIQVFIYIISLDNIN